jgi:hypothetical protein
MPRFFRNAQGGYFVTTTDVPSMPGATAVDERPSPDHTWNGSGWDAPSLTVLKAQKLEALRVRRNVARDGGIVVSGTAIPTDEQTRTVLTGVRLKTVTDTPFSVPDWKVSNGVFASLNETQIIAISDAVAAHVQACFTRERQLTDLINAATTAAALDAIDIDAGWP